MPAQAGTPPPPLPFTNIQPIPPVIITPPQSNATGKSDFLPAQNIEKPTPAESKPEEKVQPNSAPTKEDHIDLSAQASLQNQLSQLATEKIALEKELQKLQQQFSGINTPQVTKPEVSPQENRESDIKAASPKSVISDIGILNYQQAPNLIAGVIKDPQRKLLPNIILTIKDKSGLPVRALKTNKLGQFTTATPLPNGTYLLEIEDPMKRYIFDVTQISLSGKIFLPIELIARGEKELMREKLSKELFGNQIM